MERNNGRSLRFLKHIAYTYMGVSEKGGTPKISILIGFSTIKPSILGYPYFWKPPYIYQMIWKYPSSCSLERQNVNQFVQYELPLYHQLPGIYLDFGTGSLGQFCRPNTVGHTRMAEFLDSGWWNWLGMWYVAYLGGGFRYFFFAPIWGRFPIWLIFFKWVETTN